MNLTTNNIMVKPEQLPIVEFDYDVYIAMLAICRSVDIELGWHGLVKRVDGGNRHRFRIYDYHICKQKLTTGGTCEFFEGALVEDMVYDKKTPEALVDVKFWAHSHHTMSTGPSQQDIDEGWSCALFTIASPVEAGWYLTGIFNHAGDINIAYYDYRTGIRIEGIKYEVIGLPHIGDIKTTLRQVLTTLSDAEIDSIAAKESETWIRAKIKADVDSRIATISAEVRSKLAIPERIQHKDVMTLDIETYFKISSAGARRAYCEEHDYCFNHAEDLFSAMTTANSSVDMYQGHQGADYDRYIQAQAQTQESKPKARRKSRKKSGIGQIKTPVITPWLEFDLTSAETGDGWISLQTLTLGKTIWFHRDYDLVPALARYMIRELGTHSLDLFERWLGVSVYDITRENSLAATWTKTNYDRYNIVYKTNNGEIVEVPWGETNMDWSENLYLLECLTSEEIARFEFNHGEVLGTAVNCFRPPKPV